MLPAGFAGGSGLSSLFRRGLLTGSLNLGSQLAQEGSEGDLILSVGLGALQGAMTAPGAASTMRGAMNPGEAVKNCWRKYARSKAWVVLIMILQDFQD